MKIIADTAALIAPNEGDNYGITVMPVCVAINGRSYQDYSEISSAEFLEQVKKGGMAFYLHYGSLRTIHRCCFSFLCSHFCWY